MAKRMVSAALALVALLLAAVSMMVLAPASAEAGVSHVVWLDTAYKGSDPLLGVVQAYEAGSTATMKAWMRNTTGEDLSIRGAKVKFDWQGGEYAASPGDFPATLAGDETAMATIGFTVPGEATASGLVPHSYMVSVDCEKEGGYWFGSPVAGQRLGTGDGVQTDFGVSDTYVDPDSLKVYLNGVATTDYVLTQPSSTTWPASIKFNTPPADGWPVTVDYQSTLPLASGDGRSTGFSLGNAPVVPGSLKIYVENTPTTAYTVDAETGRVEFASPAALGARIVVSYQYYQRWTYAGSDFAVYSADQNAAMAARQKLEAIGAPALNTTGSRERAARAALEEQLGDQAYAAGNLEAARAHYEEAYALMDRALSGDKDPNTLKEVEPTGALLLGLGMVLLAFGAILYVLRMPGGGRRY